MTPYCYSNERGDREVLYFPMGKAPKTVKINGLTATRDFRAEQCPKKDPHGVTPGGWPRESEIAFGVHPKQRKQFADKCKRLGVPTHITERGNAILESPSHQKRLAKALGMYDRAAWY